MASISSLGSSNNLYQGGLSSDLATKIQQSLPAATKVQMEIEQMGISAFTSDSGQTDSSSSLSGSSSGGIFDSSLTSILANQTGISSDQLAKEMELMNQRGQLDPAVYAKSTSGALQTAQAATVSNSSNLLNLLV
jgi:hypothetical protein